jgi:hypothetical protein
VAGGSRSEVVTLHQEHRFSGAGALPGERDTINAAAENDNVHPLRKRFAPS